MSIVYHESSKIFHLYNQTISYIMMVLPNGHMGQLYYGKKIRDKEDFSYLLELAPRDMASYLYENDRTFSLGHIKLEYGTYGSGDYRHPAVEILQNDGSTYSDFQFTGYQVTSRKPKLPGLPATYTEQDGEAETASFIYNICRGRCRCPKCFYFQSGRHFCTGSDRDESLPGSS